MFLLTPALALTAGVACMPWPSSILVTWGQWECDRRGQAGTQAGAVVRQQGKVVPERGSLEEMTGEGQAMPQRRVSPAQVSRQEAGHWIQAGRRRPRAHTPGVAGLSTDSTEAHHCRLHPVLVLSGQTREPPESPW